MSHKKIPFKALLLSFMAVFFLLSGMQAQTTPPSAEEVLQNAYKQAAREDKNVFVIFHASWCGWCHRMIDAMNDSSCKKLFTDNYIIRHLVVRESPDKKKLENPGAMDLLVKYHGDKSGIPFWLIFDKNGKLLADSQIRPDGAGLDVAGKNAGCPVQPEELARFKEALKLSSSLNEQQLAVIMKRFAQIAQRNTSMN